MVTESKLTRANCKIITYCVVCDNVIKNHITFQHVLAQMEMFMLDPLNNDQNIVCRANHLCASFAMHKCWIMRVIFSLVYSHYSMMNAVQTFFHNGAFLCDYIESNFLVSIHKIYVLSHALIPYISTSSLASHTIKTDMSVYGDTLIAISYFEMPKPL